MDRLCHQDPNELMARVNLIEEMMAFAQINNYSSCCIISLLVPF